MASRQLIGGPSGANKSTLIIDLLIAQRASKTFLGHKTFGMPFIVISADRGENANERTLNRMGFKESEIPIERLPMVHGPTAVQLILAAVEKQDVLPSVVFIEGCDLLVENALRMEFVTPFMSALQKIAKHYHIAIIGSVGSAKHKIGEGYVAKRDSVFGSIAWSRMAETVALLEYYEGNDMDCRRLLSVLPRNAAPESFNLKMENGRLIVDNPKVGTLASLMEYPENVWFRVNNWFTVADYAAAMKVSSAKAYRDVQNAYTKHILKTKQKASGAAREYHWNDSGTNPLLKGEPQNRPEPKTGV